MGFVERSAAERSTALAAAASADEALPWRERAERLARAPLPRLASIVDDGVHAVEKAFITAALLAMTATVSLDIVDRSFSSPESKIGTKLASLLGLFFELGSGAAAFLNDWVGPAILAAVTFAAGIILSASIQRKRERPWSWGLGAGAGVGLLVAGYAFARFVVDVPSRWVCLTLLLASVAGYAFVAARHRRWSGVAVAGALGALGLILCPKLPSKYIWSQELSLILLAWVAFLGGSLATREGKHIFVEALAKAVPRPAVPWTSAAGLGVTAAFCGYIVILAVNQIVTVDLPGGEVRPSTRLPAWTITAAAATAFSLMALRFGAATVDHLVNPRPPEKKELL